MVVPLEVELHRRGSLHAPKEKHNVDRPWSNGSRAALLSRNPQKASAVASVSPAEADGSAVEEEKKLLGKRGQKLKQAGRINCLTYIPEARVIAAGREDGKLLLWKVWKTEGCNRDVTVLAGHNGRVSSLIHMPSNTRGAGSYLLFSGSSDLSIKVWDPSLRVPEKVCIQTLTGHGGTVTCMALVGRNNLVSGSTDATVRLWRAGAKDQGGSSPSFTLHRTIAVMDDWVNAMSFDTTRRVGDLGILYTADSAGGVTAFLPQVAEGMWRPDGTAPLDFNPAGAATSYGLLGSAKSVRLFGMGASSRGTSAASRSSDSHGLSTRASSRATDVSVPATPLLSQSPESPTPPRTRSPSPLRARSPEPPNPPRAHSPGASSRSPARSPDCSNSSRARSPDPPSRSQARSPEPLNIPSARTPEPLSLAWQERAAAPLERISEGVIPAPASPERKMRIPTRFSPDVEAHLDAKEEAERERSGSRASTSTRDDSSAPSLCRNPSLNARKGNVKLAPAPVSVQVPATVMSPKPAFLRLEKAGVSHVLYQATQHLVVTLARDQRARAYDEQRGSMLFAYENPHQCLFTGVAWDRAHQEIILVDDAGYVHVYSLHLPGISCSQQISSDACTGVLFLDDCDTIAAACGDHVVFLRAERERDFHTLRDSHRGPVVAFSYMEKGKAAPGGRDSDWLFSAGADGAIKQWDLDSMTCRLTLRTGKAEPSCLLFCDEEERLVCGHEDGSISLWNLDTRQALMLREQSNTITGLAYFSRKNGDHCLATASFDGTVAVWNIHSTPDASPHLIEKFVAHEDAEILCVAHSTRHELLFTAGNDLTIKVWATVRYTEPRGALCGHEAPVTCLLLEGDLLFSGSEDGTIRIWDISVDLACALQRTLEGHKSPVTDFAVQKVTGRLLSSSQDMRVLVWDYEKGHLLKTIPYGDELRCLAARAENEEILVGTTQGSILVYGCGAEAATDLIVQRDGSEGESLMEELESRLQKEGQPREQSPL